MRPTDTVTFKLVSYTSISLTLTPGTFTFPSRRLRRARRGGSLQTAISLTAPNIDLTRTWRKVQTPLVRALT